MDLLSSVTQAFASSLELEATLQNAVTQIIHYMHAEAASLFLLDDDGQTLVCRASAGPHPIHGFSIPVTQGIVGKTVRESRIQFIRDVSQDPDFAGFVDQETGFVTRSILCAPLVLKDQKIGALEVMNRVDGDGLFDASDRQLLQVLASSASLVIHNARMATALVEQERVRKELELAREIQANLLPRKSADGSPVAGINISAREVSGDFYDFYPLPKGRIGFSLGDVSGKGMNAALLMAKTCSLLHCLGREINDPALLLEKVNKEVCESATRGMFVTLVTGIYDTASGALTLANAGHQPPLLRDPRGGYRELPALAPPLGIMSGMRFENQQVDLGGGCIYLFSDGVSEGQGPDGRELGVAGLQALIDQYTGRFPQDRVGAIVAEINAGKPARRDDVTLLVIDDGIAGAERAAPLSLKITADPQNLAGMRQWLESSLQRYPFEPKERELLILAVNEACMNVIQHGYKGDPSGEIILEIIDNEGELEFRITDFADTVDAGMIAHRRLDEVRPGGLGVYFISRIMDDYTYRLPDSGVGNLLVMKKTIGAARTKERDKNAM